MANKKSVPVVNKGVKAESNLLDDTLYICAFYINGSQLNGGDPPHLTPWETLDDCKDAARAYMNELNAWWAAAHPGELYLDEESGGVFVDTLHPNVRVGTIPAQNDGHPAGPTGSILLDFADGSDWIG